MNPQPPSPPVGVPIILALLGMAFLVAMMIDAERKRARRELEDQRRQRAHLEVEVDKLEEQRDQLLQHIHQTKTPDGGEQPGE